MVHTDFGWSCPQCGSAIIDASKGDAGEGDELRDTTARAAASGSLRG